MHIYIFTYLHIHIYKYMYIHIYVHIYLFSSFSEKSCINVAFEILLFVVRRGTRF